MTIAFVADSYMLFAVELLTFQRQKQSKKKAFNVFGKRFDLERRSWGIIGLNRTFLYYAYVFRAFAPVAQCFMQTPADNNYMSLGPGSIVSQERASSE